MAVLISRPGVGPSCECLPFSVTCLDAELSTQAIEAAAQHFGIEVSWSLALDVGTRPIERHQKVSVFLIYPMAPRPLPEKSDDRGLPIDEGPVHVERDSVEIGNPKGHNPVSLRTW
jgi:hypothetical protein